MPDLADGESVEVQGSARLPYVLKNVGGVYSCSCPAWRNQSLGIERRSCKHLRVFRGEAAERERIGDTQPALSQFTAGEHDKAPPVLLAQSWENDQDLSGWWMSEKLDGCRAWWDGCHLRSRQGNVFHAPGWFTAGLPKVPLDGELWVARKAFQRTVSIVRRHDGSEHWRAVKYLVFDLPAARAPFEERLAELRDLVATCQPPYALVHEHELCRSEEHLRDELVRVTEMGGEGLMLRQPGSQYEAGRSPTLLKVKSFRDAEARVIGHLPGTGRHQGRLGALAVELADGTSFCLGTGFSDAQRKNPPPIGSLVTFRYQELSDRGVPRFPSFLRVCHEPHQPLLGQSVPQFTNPDSAARREPAKSYTKDTITMRRFEFVGGTSAKFWEVSMEGSDVTVRFGRLGTVGQ
jgi:DNA ligase-1